MINSLPDCVRQVPSKLDKSLFLRASISNLGQFYNFSNTYKNFLEIIFLSEFYQKNLPIPIDSRTDIVKV